MSCRRFKRWVLRHGGADVPARWREHVAGCDECRAFVAQVKALDDAVGSSEIPDPGEAYWDGFAPRVARRLEDARQSTRPVIATPRPVWIRIWAPAVGIAVLAFLIARDLVVDQTPKTLMERDVPVAVAELEESKDRHEPATPDVVEEATRPSELANLDAVEPSSGKPMTAVEGRVRKEPGPAQEPPSSTAEIPPGEATIADLETETAPGQRAAATTPAEEPPEEVSVWPDRRVQKMGDVDSDLTGRAADDGGLAEAGSRELEEGSYNLAVTGAETSAALLPPPRLEAPQTYRASRPMDSQSPTEVMRRFDELQDLRREISLLAAIDASDRTPGQEHELCAMWYRVGAITVDLYLLDSAIQHVNQCLEQVDESELEEWQSKSRQLAERRASMSP